MKRLLIAGIVGLTLLLQGEPPQSAKPLPAPVQRKLERRALPFDQPLAAWSFQRQKRLGGGQGQSAAALYRQAARRVSRLDRYSSALGRRLPPGVWAKRDPLAEWRDLGPGNIGGRTRAMVIDPEQPAVMYAAGVSGGVWKIRSDSGRWRPVGDELANLAVNALAIDPGDPSVLYAGTGEGYFREVVRQTSLPLRGGGIFKSEDGGGSWRQLPRTRGKKFHWVNDLHVSHHDSNRIYAATRKGVFRSLDGGERWKRVFRPKKTQGGCLDLAARTDTVGDFLFVSCGTLSRGAVYRQTAAEGGGRWQEVLAESGQGRTSLAVAPSNQDVIYALASSTVPGPEGNFLQALHAVFRSDRGGAPGSWRATVRNDDPRKVNTLLLSNPIVAAIEECGFEGANEYFAMGWYVNVIAVDPTDPERVWAGGVDLFRSDDGGRNWNPATYWWANGGSNLVHADQHGLVFHPRDPNTLFSLNDGGIYRTTNAAAPVASGDDAICSPGSSSVLWRSFNLDYGVTQFYHGSVFPDATTILAGAQDNGTIRLAVDEGRWGRRVLGGDGGYSAVDPEDPDVLYATIQNGLVFKSTDGGREFFERTVGLSDLATNDDDDFRAVGDKFLFISPLLLDPLENQRLWSGGIRLWRTDDGAFSWTAASRPLAGRASALALAPGDSDIMLVGTENGVIHRSTGATRADESTEWNGARPRGGFVSSLAFDPADPAVAYATYAGFGGDHVWRSRDGGETWAPIDGSGPGALPNMPIHSLAVDPADSTRLYLGTDLGVLVSTDGGGSWAAENTGFARAVTESLAIARGADGTRYLYAFTHGRGAWRVALVD